MIEPTCSLRCSSFLGLPYRILIIYLVKPEKGTTMETIGRADAGFVYWVCVRLECRALVAIKARFVWV